MLDLTSYGGLNRKRPTAKYVMRRADPYELDAVMSLIDARISWLKNRGTDQWSTLAFRPRMANAIANGETWLIWEGSTPVATGSITTVGFADFWTEQERREPALYLSKIATSLDHQGQGLGELFISSAYTYALRRGIPRLRWDVWRSNQALQRYYSSLEGVKYLRTVDVPPWNTGALFEMAFCPERDLQELIAIDDHILPLATLNSTIRRQYDLGYETDDPYRNAPIPAFHTVTGLYAPPLSSEAAQASEELSIPCGGWYGVLLYDAGSGWQLHKSWSHPITRWDNPPRVLRSGLPYTIGHEPGWPDRRACRIVLLGDLT